MTGSSKQIFLLIPLIAALSPLTAYGMLRVFKYKPLTVVNKSQVCMFAKHEHNPKKENALNPLNGTSALACNLTVVATDQHHTPKKTYSKSALQTFPYGKLTKTCFDFPAEKAGQLQRLTYEGVHTECALLSAAPRVFPHWPKEQSFKQTLNSKVTKPSKGH